MEHSMEDLDWKTKFVQLRRYHNSVARQWMHTQDAERKQHNTVLESYEKKIADLKKEKKDLLLELEKAHTLGL